MRDQMRCECWDAGCKGQHAPEQTGVMGTQCPAQGTIHVARYDYETNGDHFMMCETCADDACESGVFSVEEPDDEDGESCAL